MSLIAYKDGLLIADTLGLVTTTTASHYPRFHMQKIHKTPAGYAAFAYCGPELLQRAIIQAGTIIDASLLNMSDRSMEYTPLLISEEAAKVFIGRKWIIVTGSSVYTHLKEEPPHIAFDEIPLDGFAFDGTLGETFWMAHKGFDIPILEAAEEATMHVYGTGRGDVKIDHVAIKTLPTNEKRRKWLVDSINREARRRKAEMRAQQKVADAIIADIKNVKTTAAKPKPTPKAAKTPVKRKSLKC